MQHRRFAQRAPVWMTATLVAALGLLPGQAWAQEEPGETPAPTASPGAGESYFKTPFRGRRPFQLDVHAGVAWYGFGLASGARFGIPIVQNGFIGQINNAIYINFGADVYWVNDWDPWYGWRYSVGLGFPVTFHWEFYFTPRWTAFGEAGVNVFLTPSVLRGDGYRLSYWADWIIFQVGGRFMINKHVALTLRVGSPYTAFGVSFFF